MGTDDAPGALTARARELWEFLAVGWAVAQAGGEAGTSAAGGTGFAPALRVIAAPGSALCPPGWAGIVVLGDAVLATAPDAGTARLVEQGLAGLPAASLTDAYRLRNQLPVAEILGPSSLAYLDPAEFRPHPGTAAITPLGLDDPVFRQFVLAADPEEAEESGLLEITTPAFAVREHGQVAAAAGYRDWPRGTAHLSVLTAAAARGRGLARAAASAAVARAIADGRFPQWRARPMASRRVARALGFRELGLQVCVRLAAPVAPGEDLPWQDQPPETGGAMPAERLMPNQESGDLIELTRSIVDKELRPLVDEAERAHAFRREAFTTLGRAGLLSLPYPEEYGGGGQPYEVYLQVLEEIAAAWAAVGVGVSVHALSCFGLFHAGTDEQKERWLPDMLGGELLGAYCLSEAHAGSDPAAMRTRAVRDGDDYVITGAKAWTTHGGVADFYKVMARTSDDGGRGISCFLVPAGTPGLSSDVPEDKMGLMSSPTTTMLFDNVRVPAERRLGAEGQGLPIALAGLDSGRLGIAAVATGVAQGALDVAVRYAKERESFGKPIIDHQGLAFLLADMAAAVESARATYLYAARLRDAGRPFSRQASIAKMTATDNAMRVTTDAVQVLGGAGYTRDFPVERYMRETKVMQIFEGTNQIQRLVISRDLAKG